VEVEDEEGSFMFEEIVNNGSESHLFQQGAPTLEIDSFVLALHGFAEQE
jgi:hypothetical protein